MTTSLAQQLNALKITQKDVLSTPQRARVSFLFESKQAANIDDQTLYYICKSGVKQLKDSRTIDLSSFESNILDEKSLSFYRGTETEQTLTPIDQQIDALLRAIAPYLLEQPTLKVVEYLLRVYEVHVYHKQTLIQCFVPLFETVYFLRIIQCLNLKDDQVWGWLHQFAYEGVSIDKTTLVKCISRNNGLVFCKIASFCLEVMGDLHLKFFGVFMTEVLKQNSHEGLMFGILPFISQGLKQSHSKNLRLSCLFSLGQLACRRTLTKEYTAAFIRQILLLITAKDRLEFDEDQKLKGLTTLLFFTQYQQVHLDKKDFTYLNKTVKINKLLEQISKQFDTSSLALVILQSSFDNQMKPDEIQELLQPLLNLKTVYLLAQNLCNRAFESQETTNQLLRLQLDMLKSVAPQQFQQSIVYILKQIPEPVQKETIMKFIQGGEQGNLLVTYGDKEYSILSALSSERQQTREAALNSLNDKLFVKVLSKKEADLVGMVLLQILSGSGVEEKQFVQIIGSLKLVSSLSDPDFEVLMNLFDRISEKKIVYSKSASALCVELLCQMQLKTAQNQIMQAWIAFQHKQQLEPANPFFDVVQQKQGKAVDALDFLVSKILERPQKYLSLLLTLFQNRNASIDFSLVSKTLKKLGVAVQKDLLQSTIQSQLMYPILSIMKIQKIRNANEILVAIIDGIQQDQINCESKLINKLIGVSLVQKQFWGQSFDLVQLHKKLSTDISKFAELMITIALTSSSKLKRMFAIQVIVFMHQKGTHQFQLNSQISYKIMIGSVLGLFNDTDRQIREGAVKLAEIMLETQKQAAKESSLAVIEVFGETEKPSSVQKRPQKLTPMKSKTVISLLEDLIAAKSDLVVERGQLKLVLSKHQKPEVYEEILRSLLDYPTAQLKQKLLEVLSLPQKHAIIFCMNLSQSLAKVFVQLDKQPSQKSGFLTALGSLIAHLQDSAPQSSKKEVFTSLTLPYLKYITDSQSNEAIVLQCFDVSVLKSQVLKEVDQRYLVEVFKLFIKCKPKQKLRLLFIQNAAAVFKGDDLAQCLVDQIDLELVLETIISLAPTPSAKLFQKTVETLQKLVVKFVENTDNAYQIELCSQLAKQCVPGKSDRTAKLFGDILNATQQVWSQTKKITQKGLEQELDKRIDPFDEFMQSDVKENNDNDDEDSEREVDLLPCLQVLTSLLNLLTPIEQKESLGSIESTTMILNDIADFMQQVCQTKSAVASIQAGIKSQLYHLYQSLILRTTQRPAEGRPYSQLITKYLSCSVKLIEQGGMSKLLGENFLVLNTIKQLPEYSSLVTFTLMWLASQDKLDLTDQNLIKVGYESNAALYLGQETLLWYIDINQDVSPLRDLIFNLHHVQVQKDAMKIDKQTEQLFGGEEQTFSWTKQCNQIVQNSSPKQLRRFIFFVCTMLNQWLVKTTSFVSRIAPIAGVDQPSTDVQQQLLHMILSSYLLREQIQVLLQTETSQSLTRLQTCINSLQETLNDMMSLQIHIQTVMEILDMVPQTLKSNTLCLLLDKLATFQSGWLAKFSSGLHAVFVTLVDKCLTMLESGNNTESLSQQLLTVVSRTASTSLPKTLQIRSVETTMKHHKGSLQLQTQTVLTEMNLMETYSFQMLDYFHHYLKHTLDGFQTNKDQLFVDTYKHALLKSLVCISQVFLKFLSADQLEQVITYSIMAAAEKVIATRQGDPVEIILESISSEAPQYKKLIMQATMNSYSILLKNAKGDQFDAIATRYFQQLLSPVLRCLPQSYISEHNQKFVLFFKQMFSLPQKADTSSSLIVECFNAFILKLNEETLRPIIVIFTKWAQKEPRRRLILFQILCGCLNTLREFFVPMIKIYFEDAFTALTSCKQDLDVGKQNKRTHSSPDPTDTLVLLKQVCHLFELNYKYDTSSFIQNDTFEQLCDPIADLFDLITIPQFDTMFVELTLKPLILEMDERSNDDNMWQKLNFVLLMKTRSEQWQTRLAVLTVIENLFDKMRERYLVILNDTIPFISELLEDEDERVEQAAKRIVLRIEQLTGESINEYLK